MKFTIRDLLWLTLVVALGVNNAFGEPPKLKLVPAEQKLMAVESVKKRGWYSYEEVDTPSITHEPQAAFDKTRPP